MDNVDSVVETYDKATRKGSKSDALEDIYDLKEKLEKNDHFLNEVSNKNDILTKENKKLKEEKAALVKEKDEALSRCTLFDTIETMSKSHTSKAAIKKNQRINAYDQKGKENAVLIKARELFLQNAKEQRQCSSTLVDSVKKKCSDDYGSLNKTTSGTEKEFVRKCSELCWYMVCSDPPMAIEYENIENKAMDSIKFNKYNRTGTIVEYVVWPVLLLHIDGPVLAKGSVQTNIEPKNDRIVARKKSVESVIAPPLACKSISNDDHVTFPSQTTNNNTKSENIQVQTIPSKKTVTNQLEISDVVLDLKDSQQKDQSISQNKGKPDDDSNMREAGTLKQQNSSDDIRVVIEHSKENFSNVKSTGDKLTKQNIAGRNVVNGGVLKTAKLDQSCSGDLNTQYESDKTCTTDVSQSPNVSSDTSRNKHFSASTEKNTNGQFEIGLWRNNQIKMCRVHEVRGECG